MVKTENVGFPIYSLAFTPKKPRLVIGGGGGANRSGIKNAILMKDINTISLESKVLSEIKFGADEDGCMSLAIHPKEKVVIGGINRSQELIKEGNNENFQTCAQFSPDGKILATGTSDGKPTYFGKAFFF
ncbi:hypothetical protein HK096_001136 [Nowakowskiella sp. JEL0078]|nr:hypothetical protein HK096_001136 [Nowakowskiella sp. JEL0078]